MRWHVTLGVIPQELNREFKEHEKKHIVPEARFSQNGCRYRFYQLALQTLGISVRPGIARRITTKTLSAVTNIFNDYDETSRRG